MYISYYKSQYQLKNENSDDIYTEDRAEREILKMKSSIKYADKKLIINKF